MEVDLTPSGMGIAAVERDTGLSKDLLRVWERRYGFPQPHRDAVGDRLYPLEQVQRLRLIKRLLDAGHRPHQVVALPEEALAARLQALPPLSRDPKEPRTAAAEASVTDLDVLLAPLLRHQPHELMDRLQAELLRLGLKAYITDRLAPLIERVGQLWAEGRVQIHEEHLFSEVVQQQLHRAMAQLGSPSPHHRPRILLTTLPGESHGLGLMMAQCLLAAEGAECRSLGLETPIPEVLEACQRHQADVLALSFSSYASAALIESGMTALAAGLGDRTLIWCGGRAAGLSRPLVRRLPTVQVTAELGDLVVAVQAWRAHHPLPSPTQ
ncbi:MerR family transcriptional regulator [Inhella gelatinilytica]|uniref:MerR family transcriptional regulator n=1 Tax=Inhella gelatinilytica TaxID=2795030 RepID=A0A931IW32_9BURK|nr:MerR family transcriptional regulator [Inhella gelatinilytica]MBH9551698.1 MerR family transcriptional regulator [Inhella gelatinilytica]